jgi:hypothetical protein
LRKSVNEKSFLGWILSTNSQIIVVVRENSCAIAVKLNIKLVEIELSRLQIQNNKLTSVMSAVFVENKAIVSVPTKRVILK